MKKTLVFSKSPSAWESLLAEYFSEVDIENITKEESGMIARADLVFAEAEFLSLPRIQKIRAAKNLNPQLRVIGLGVCPRELSDLFDVILPDACNLFDLTKKISEKLPLPKTVTLLVADDDPEILSMVSDYFEGRQQPVFEVVRAANGLDAWDQIQKKDPNAVILDMKMPGMKGSEVYTKIQKSSKNIPTVIFFDAISSGDLDLVRKLGRPVIVEKGYRESSMPYLLASIKKLIYFSDK